MAENDQAYSVLEIARHTGLHPETIRRWVNKHAVTPEPTKTKKGGYRIRKSEIIRHIRKTQREIQWQ